MYTTKFNISIYHSREKMINKVISIENIETISFGKLVHTVNESIDKFCSDINITRDKLFMFGIAYTLRNDELVHMYREVPLENDRTIITKTTGVSSEKMEEEILNILYFHKCAITIDCMNNNKKEN